MVSRLLIQAAIVKLGPSTSLTYTHMGHSTEMVNFILDSTWEMLVQTAATLFLLVSHGEKGKSTSWCRLLSHCPSWTVCQVEDVLTTIGRPRGCPTQFVATESNNSRTTHPPRTEAMPRLERHHSSGHAILHCFLVHAVVPWKERICGWFCRRADAKDEVRIERQRSRSLHDCASR